MKNSYVVEPTLVTKESLNKEKRELIKKAKKNPPVVKCDLEPRDPQIVYTPHISIEVKVQSHLVRKPMIWDLSELELYYLKTQTIASLDDLSLLVKELKVIPTYNANVLDFLLRSNFYSDHYLIPKEWRHDSRGNPIEILFPKTVYEFQKSKYLFVRSMYWFDAPTRRDRYSKLYSGWNEGLCTIGNTADIYKDDEQSRWKTSSYSATRTVIVQKNLLKRITQKVFSQIS